MTPDEVEKALLLAKDIARPFEGLRLTPYHDPAGYPTVGYGHLLSREKFADLSQWPAITETHAEELLDEDMRNAMGDVLRQVRVELTVNQAAVLVDFVFNFGASRFKRSSLLRCVNHREFDAAALEFQKWVWAGGKRLPGLIKRREAERALFCSEGSI